MNINDITITSIETITAFDVATGSFKFVMDELQSATIAQSQESTEITGKGGRKLSTLKKNKSVTISGTNGLISGGLLELQTGGTFENKATKVLWTDNLTVTKTEGENVTTSEVATTYTAVGTAGAEIENIYVKNTNGTLGTQLVQAATLTAGKFTYNPSTKKLTFNLSDVADGAEIVAYYKRNITADVLENKSDAFSGKATLFIDALAEDKCNNIYRVQFYIPKADFSGEFSFEMGDNQTVHSFEAQALVGACGIGGTMWTYTIFGAETTDTATT